MLIKTKHLLTALVVAGIAVTASQAQAATLVAGDILLGFRTTSGAGVGTDTIINLGQADTVFRNATTNLNLGNISAALNLYGGAGAWESNANLSWGALAVRSNANTGSGATFDGDPARTNYVTQAQSPLTSGAQASTRLDLGSGARGTVANDIVILNNLFAATAATGTTAGGYQYITVASSDSSSWTTTLADIAANAGVAPEAGAVAGGIDTTGLDLYRVLHLTTGATPTGTIGQGSWEGAFALSSAGNLSFNVTAAAVPEPSRALLAGLGLSSIFFRRRRSAKA